MPVTKPSCRLRAAATTLQTRGARLGTLVLLALSLSACQAGDPGEGPGDAPPSAAAAAPLLVYVGTASGDPAQGIHAFRFDPAAGTLTPAADVTLLMNPSFLATSPAGDRLYAVSETSDLGTVHAYRIDRATGGLTPMNHQTTGGTGPAHVSVDATGSWVLVANYGGGSVALLPATDDGLGPAAEVAQHTGSGPNPDRQEGPHAHYAHVGPSNQYVYAADLGIDRVRIYPLDAEAGRLNADAAREAVAPPGAGPRHLAFHPNGRWAYLVHELTGAVAAHQIDPATGDLEALQTVSTLPDDFEGANKSADIHVHPNGRWLYASNRGDFDSIAILAIDPDSGRLTPAGHHRDGIHWPRHFAITPSGRHLLVANRHADEVRVLALDPATGALTDTGTHVAVPQPTNVTLVAPGG